MPDHRKTYSASRARRTSRKVHEHTVGTHVVQRTTTANRRAPSSVHRHDYKKELRRRARIRRALVAVVAVVLVVGVALGAGFLAFRGSVGSNMALRDSDAPQALVAPKSTEPYYTVVTAEIGATAKPLEIEGPDIVLLVRVDNNAKSMAVVDIPSSLQITEDNRSVGLGSLAGKGDAALIEAVSSFAKVDVAHIVKISQEGLVGMVDALGGIDVDIEQVIDDPRAGDVYFPTGRVTLTGATSLVYLRADNLKLGTQDKLAHQLNFATLVLERVFCAPGSFHARIESIDSYFQTDCSLGDFENVAAWLSGKSAEDIVSTALPGYTTAVTGVTDDGKERFIGSSDDMAEVLAALEEGRTPPSSVKDGTEASSSRDFTVEVQNGTSVTGAASLTAEMLKEKGFKLGSVGNAEQQVYQETLVVYKGDEGLAQAKAVIEALDVGRPVSAGSYYSFESDVLLIIGSDFSPVT